MMRKLLVFSIGLAVSTVIAYGGEVGDASLGRVKANFVRVLKDTNALVYSEIAKMGGVPPVADSSIRTVAESGGVSEKRVEQLIRAQRADGSWPSVDYTSALRSQWPANEHLKNLRTLASARRTPETEQAFHKALGFWLNGRFRNPNWWWNQIGVPLRIGASALLMDDVLTAEERADVVKLMQESRIQMTGQNKVWLEERSGSWCRHMGSMPDQRATGRVFEITIPHGVQPSAASCVWRVGIRTIEERSM